LWVNEWLDGTTRYQMSSAQRAFWIDLLAMAGRSKFGGVVCSGKDGENWVGYPLNKFQGLLAEPVDILATFDLFIKTGKIRLEKNGTDPELYVVFILSWDRYQSEYQRVSRYRGQGTNRVQAKSQPTTHQSNTTEVDSDLEEEREGDTEKEIAQNKPDSPPSEVDSIDKGPVCPACGEIGQHLCKGNPNRQRSRRQPDEERSPKTTHIPQPRPTSSSRAAQEVWTEIRKDFRRRFGKSIGTPSKANAEVWAQACADYDPALLFRAYQMWVESEKNLIRKLDCPAGRFINGLLSAWLIEAKEAGQVEQVDMADTEGPVAMGPRGCGIKL
jgi:hypothetical protein